MKQNSQYIQDADVPAGFDELYSQLPRFIDESAKQTGKETGSRKVAFSWQDTDYELIVHPAQIQIENQENKYLLPGKREKAVEQGILKLSRSDLHFDSRTFVITFTAGELAEAVKQTSGANYSEEELEETIDVLAHAQYRLSFKDTVFSFQSLDPVRQKTVGKEILFQVRPTGFIFGTRLQPFSGD